LKRHIDEEKIIFSKLGAQVASISRSMVILIISLRKKIYPFSKKSESHDKPKYHEELRKEEEVLKIKNGTLVTYILSTYLKWK
jgi:hypothetical protein